MNCAYYLFLVVFEICGLHSAVCAGGPAAPNSHQSMLITSIACGNPQYLVARPRIMQSKLGYGYATLYFPLWIRIHLICANSR
jgi:hypothetical protein